MDIEVNRGWGWEGEMGSGAEGGRGRFGGQAGSVEELGHIEGR